MFQKFRYRMAMWMQGRYGGRDTLNKWLLGAFFIVILLSLLFNLSILNILSWVILIYAYFRMFSRNIQARYRENQKFEQFLAPMKDFFARKKAGGKTHKIFICPGCKQKVRVPKGKGKISICCPKCHTEFIKRS